NFSIFFLQAEDGIRYFHGTGVQTCALPIWPRPNPATEFVASRRLPPVASARVPTQGKTPRLHDRSDTTVFDLTAGSPSPRRTLRGTPRAAASRIAPLATLWAARARGSSGASSLPVSARDGRGISP